MLEFQTLKIKFDALSQLDGGQGPSESLHTDYQK